MRDTGDRPPDHRHPGTSRPSRPGLDADGSIAREGSLTRVPDVFAPVVSSARTRLSAVFGERLHSAYLYGSVPRGTARVGRSDLDLLVVLRDEPGPADRAAATALDAELDAAFPQVDGVGTLLFGRGRVLSEPERYDLGWFVACLCTPLLGDDLAVHLPRYRPTGLLARETNGDLAVHLVRWRERIAAADDTEAARRPLVRYMSRHLVRTAFTLVMPRWNGWTSDLYEMADAFAAYYPDQDQDQDQDQDPAPEPNPDPEPGPPERDRRPRRATQLRTAARYGYEPVGDPAVLRSYVDDVGPWLAAEYARVHGVPAQRP